MTDLDASHYRNHSEEQYALAYETLSSLSLKEIDSVLDIGCGDGRITAEIARSYPHITIRGIDPSPDMIRLANTLEALPNLDFIQGAAEDFYAGPPVDVILMMSALHWIRDPQKAIAHFADHLKFGGVFLAVTYPKESPYWQFLEQTAQEMRIGPTHQPLTSSMYRELFEKNGFKIETFSLQERVATYASSSKLMNYIKGWLRCYLSLPPQTESVFLERACTHAKNYSLSSQRSDEIHLPYLKLVFKASLN